MNIGAALRLAYDVISRLVTFEPGPKPKPAARPAPILPAEARGHVLVATKYRNGGAPVWKCARCPAFGTHFDLGFIACAALRAEEEGQ